MKYFKHFLIFSVLFFMLSCGISNGNGDSGNSGDSGDSGNTGNTTLPDENGDSGNSGNSGNSGDSGNSGKTDKKCDCFGKEYTIPAQYSNIQGWCMADEDSDGIPNCIEVPNGVPVDTDEDNTPDYKDDDSDGDKTPDSVECSELPCRDTDEDGVPDYRDTDSDGDGILDIVECPEQPCIDSDNDKTPDYLDSDSDGDGIPDLYEGTGDVDKDGIPNFLDDDSDGDGILDSVENGTNVPPLDSDEDGTPDYLDFDSDNDGLTDFKENEIGTDPTKSDTDGDGVDDNTEHAAGSNPTVADPEWWEGKYYVTLPYNNPAHEIRTLDFSTNLSKVDIMIIIDVSGSMQAEINNLKQKLRTAVIPGINNIMPGVTDYAGFGLMSFGNNKDLMRQVITTNPTTIDNAIQGLPAATGGDEPHSEALYQAAIGDGNAKGHFPAPNCTGKEGNKGGGCYRDKALPIFLMLTDETFDDLDLIHSRAQAITAMNSDWLKAKFIGVATGTSSPNNDFKAVSQGTGSLDTSGNPFNYQIPTDASNLDTHIIAAVTALANNIQMEITTTKSKVELPESFDDLVDSTNFIKSVKPKSINSVPVVSCPELNKCDDSKFNKVKAGIEVTFDIDFHNDFYEPATTEVTAFRAKINVLGEGAALDSREVYIIVPGKKASGPND